MLPARMLGLRFFAGLIADANMQAQTGCSNTFNYGFFTPYKYGYGGFWMFLFA